MIRGKIGVLQWSLPGNSWLGWLNRYHYTNEGRTNWFDFAREIQRQARQKGLLDREIRLAPITTDQYPTQAQRPANSYLSKEKIKRTFDITIRPWQEALAEKKIIDTKR